MGELKKVYAQSSHVDQPQVKQPVVVPPFNTTCSNGENGFEARIPELKIKSEEATQFLREIKPVNNGENICSSGQVTRLRPPAEAPKPKIQLSLKYNMATLTLSVVVHRVRNLQETAISWTPSACVKTRVIEMSRPGANRRVDNTKRKTKTQRRNLSPVFEETLEYFLPAIEVRRKRLEVSVFHDSRFLGKYIGRNVVLGRCIVSLDSLADQLAENLGSGVRSATVTEWFMLMPPAPPTPAPNAKDNKVKRSKSMPRSTSAPPVGEFNGLHARNSDSPQRRRKPVRRSHSQESMSDSSK